MRICKGTIEDITGSPKSGLWLLHFAGGSKVYIESSKAMRNLAGCFGAKEGAGDLMEKLKGKTIFYGFEWGVMAGFTPEEEAPKDLLEAYEKSKGEKGGSD